MVPGGDVRLDGAGCVLHLLRRRVCHQLVRSGERKRVEMGSAYYLLVVFSEGGHYLLRRRVCHQLVRSEERKRVKIGFAYYCLLLFLGGGVRKSIHVHSMNSAVLYFINSIIV